MTLKIYKASYSLYLGYSLTILYLFQFLRNITDLYIFLLLITISLILINSLFNYGKIRISSVNFFYYFCFLLGLIYVDILTLLNFYKENINITTLANGTARLWALPLFPLFIYMLFSDKRNIAHIINIYIIFILLAALSILIQHVIGPLSFLGTPYAPLRMGFENEIAGYASLTGNVTTYGTSFYSAVLLIFFKKNFNVVLKSIMIAILIGTAIITMSKTGFLMSGIMFLTIIILSFKYRSWKFLLSLIFIILLGAIIFSDLYLAAAITLFVNTFGYELGNVSIATTTQFQNFIPRLTDRVFGLFLLNNLSEVNHFDFIFGIGLVGGGGAMGIVGPTTHNSFFDIFVMGGILFLTLTILLLTHTQISLFRLYKETRDKTVLSLFISNFMIILIMNVFNGALFHPAISLPFWISIFYLMSKNQLFKKIK